MEGAGPISATQPDDLFRVTGIGMPKISIIICTYTLERYPDLKLLLESVVLQNDDDLEVIIVAEGSRELFLRLREDLNDKHIDSTIAYYSRRLGISRARNEGVKLANSEVVSFIDDDAVLQENWKSAVLSSLEANPNILGVVGCTTPLWEDKADAWFPVDFYWIIGCSQWRRWASPRLTKFGWGSNMTLHKSIFSFCRFPENVSEGAHRMGKSGPVGDDTRFLHEATKISGRYLFYDPDTIVFHRVYRFRLSSRFIRKYAYWQGYTEAMFESVLHAGRSREDPQTTIIRGLLVYFFPELMRDFAGRPKTALKKLGVLANSISSFVGGYLSFKLRCIRQVFVHV